VRSFRIDEFSVTVTSATLPALDLAPRLLLMLVLVGGGARALERARRG
jgi:hypothetical protein